MIIQQTGGGGRLQKWMEKREVGIVNEESEI